MDDFDSILFVWINMQDGRVCPDCIHNAKLPAMTYDQWQEYGFPASGGTVCGDRCRCGLIPGNIIKVFPSIIGKSINLRSDTRLVITDKLDYNRYAELDELIEIFKIKTNGMKLPPEYYDIADLEERIALLNRLINAN